MSDKSGVKGDILRIVLLGLGLASISSIIYLAGPFIAFGELAPARE